MIKLTDLLGDDEMLWQGQPKPPFSLTMFEYPDGRPTINWGANKFMLVLFATVFPAALLAINNLYILMVMVILTGIAVFVSPEIQKALRKKNTAYCITDKGVYFQLWRDKETQVKFIPFKAIKKVSLHVFKSGRGSISLFMKSDELPFESYDFDSGKQLFHPTMIMVDDAREVTKLLREKIK